MTRLAPVVAPRREFTVPEGRTVIIVDDDPIVGKALRKSVENDRLAAIVYDNPLEFLDKYDLEFAGCIVLDKRMPGMNGLEVQERLRQMGAITPIIMITAYQEIPDVVRALQADAFHYFEKPVGDQMLIECIHRALAADRERRQDRHERRLYAQRLERLTKKELESLDFVVQGYSSKEIADEQHVSYKTIEAHRSKVMSKMEAHSIPHLVRMVLLERVVD